MTYLSAVLQSYSPTISLKVESGFLTALVFLKGFYAKKYDHMKVIVAEIKAASKNFFNPNECETS